MKLSYFRDISFLQAIKALFNELNVPVNYVADEPTSAQEILKDTYKENSTFQLVNEVYFVGMVDDAAFEGNKSLEVEKIKSDYDGILIFGVSLNQRENNLLPTRSQLAEISRAFNREFYYTPVVLVFKYADDKGQYIAFANTERLKYKQAWREGEKAGKVSLLRDIDIQRPHRGHEDIINQLRIQTSGVKAIDTFAKLYTYWQEVFSVSVLNKRFYQELSNWYFWAVKQVTFPGKPTEADAIKKNAKLEDLIQEHNATNVIRLLTRLLFTWFIKEKKLIPEELFDLEALQKDILNDIAPYHENGLFNQANKDSVYYRAILQNLFFASLNCPIKPDGTDSRERGFRGDGYGTHRGIDYLMRYKRYFKNPDAFLELMNKTVPFLNGGLFECLDDKYSNTYIDGFSDQMTKGEQLLVPDYLFFGTPEEVDLSNEYGINNSTTKKAAVKGLINILKSYKFTITENTPIEEDVALDPELLGKVFENLLASYNPETKTTARKQTGSFYTPREIVNYMVDESLIAYLKNAVTDWELDEKQVDEKLHQLASFDAKKPFVENQKLTRDIVSALDRCKILDPACGSGAFPMGVLQKMVHMLQKLDPDNLIWKEVQIHKVQEETSEVFKTIDDKAEREEKLKEINNAFDQRVNDPDYARKLYLIENCIYGVDIQPIATQISKLRFFISLVVDQKNNTKIDENFGIRPLPNLETKFVTANTLIGIEKPNAQLSLYDTKEVKELETELKKVRHKLFSARTKDTKLKYRQRDKELRNAIAVELENSGWKSDTAQKLAKWDPYDQNASSSFFDPEWMFDVADNFDVVIGNPPYINTKSGIQSEFKNYYKANYLSATGQFDLFSLFIELSARYGKTITLIVPKPLINNENYEIVRKILIKNGIHSLVIGSNIFENAGVESCIFISNPYAAITKIYHFDFESSFNQLFEINQGKFKELPFNILNTLIYPNEYPLIEKIQSNSNELGNYINILRGVESGKNDLSINSNKKGYLLLRGEDLNQYEIHESDLWIDADFRNSAKFKTKELYSSPKLCIRRVGNKVISAIDNKNRVSLNTIYNCHLKSNNKEGYWGLSAILNSTLINFWFYKVFILDDTLFPYQRVSQLEKIPIKDIITHPLLCFLSKVNHFKKNNLIIDITNSIVFNLYFPDHLKEREIDVLPFVERDIEKVMQGRDFEKLSETEKEQVIEQLHQTWSHPDSEVRNRIKLFAVRSPEILKPILES